MLAVAITQPSESIIGQHFDTTFWRKDSQVRFLSVILSEDMNYSHAQGSILGITDSV